jgi:hypothetical protein
MQVIAILIIKTLAGTATMVLASVFSPPLEDLHAMSESDSDDVSINSSASTDSSWHSTASSNDEWDETKFDADAPTCAVIVSLFDPKTQQPIFFKALLDSGSNGSLASFDAIKRFGGEIRDSKRIHHVQTSAGIFETTKCTKIRHHRIMELNSQRKLQSFVVQATPSLGSYDFIFGCNYLNRYGLDLCFSNKTIRWDGMVMPMKDRRDADLKQMDQSNLKELQAELDDEYFLQTLPQHAIAALEEVSELYAQQLIDLRTSPDDESFAQQILDAKYEKQDLKELCNGLNHLSAQQQQILYDTIRPFQDLFEGKLGTWPGDPISVELLPDAKPYHCGKAMRIPHVHLETLKKEVYRLIRIGVLEIVNGELMPVTYNLVPYSCKVIRRLLSSRRSFRSIN